MPYGRDLRLDRMRDLLARLGNPQDSLAIVHLAGTKGKGSTAAMIASILRAAGFRTGLYSSPHLERVEERLMIGGVACPAEKLAELVARIEPVVAAMDALPPGEQGASHRPTYFEVVTALALLYFASERVDAAVLEVGLGGRLDSTNVCHPLVSVITSISFDHMQQLGNTLAAIAGEKGGIIKPGVPVISGVLAPEAREVIERIAREQGSPMTQLGRDFDATYRPPRHLEQAANFAQVDITGQSCDMSGLELPLIGQHQAANAALAVATVLELRRQEWNISDQAVRSGLRNVAWPARIEVLRRHPAIVLDAAHNVASVEALGQVIDESFSAPRKLLVFATTRDKDVRGMLAELLPRFDEVIFTRYHSNPRGVPIEELAALAAELSPLKPHLCPDATTAWQLAQRLTSPDHLICITGSFFTAGEMRAAIVAAE